MCAAGTCKQVAQLHDSYVMMMVVMIKYEKQLQSPVLNEVT